MENQNESGSALNQSQWTLLRAIGHTAAAEAKLSGDYRIDCAIDFVIDVSSAGLGDLSLEALEEKAAQFARHTFYSLRRHQRREQSLEEMSENDRVHAALESVCPEPGPEDRLQADDFLCRLLAPAEQFSQERQKLLLDRALHLERFVDLAQETGRLADALSQSYANILRCLRGSAEESGITMEDVQEELNRRDRENGV